MKYEVVPETSGGGRYDEFENPGLSDLSYVRKPFVISEIDQIKKEHKNLVEVVDTIFEKVIEAGKKVNSVDHKVEKAAIKAEETEGKFSRLDERMKEERDFGRYVVFGIGLVLVSAFMGTVYYFLVSVPEMYKNVNNSIDEVKEIKKELIIQNFKLRFFSEQSNYLNFKNCMRENIQVGVSI